MSGAWETVKNKKDKHNGVTKKLTKAEKLKFLENAPKVEDLLPLSQVKTLYSTLDKSQSVKQQAKPKVKEEEKKKQVPKKPQQPQQQEKKKDKIKSFDAAIKQINLEDLQKALEVAKLRNYNTPLPTVIDILEHLNNVLQVDASDPVFSNRPVTFPLSSLPSDIKNCFVEMLNWAGKNSFQQLFERLIRDIVYDASRGLPSFGSKMVLQLIAQLKPKVAINALAECAKLKDSYQSNQKCWQSLLWSLGQAGFSDLAVGLRVWEEAMLPLIETRNYQRFVIDYLGRLVNYHSSSGNAQYVSHNEYLNALDAIFAPHGTTPAKLVDELSQHGRTLKNLALKSTARNQLHLFFEPVMGRLKSSRSDVYKKELQSFLWESLKNDHLTINVWKKIYLNKKNSGKYLAQSASLLKQIEKDLKSSKPVLNVREVKSAIKVFNEYNAKLQSTKPKTEGLRECSFVCRKISTKSVKKEKSQWKSLIFFLILGSTGAAYLLLSQQYGSFEASPVYKYLDDIGAVHYGRIAWVTTLDYTHQGVEWSKENYPVYYAKISTVLAPYAKLSADLFQVVKYSVTRAAKQLYAFSLESKATADVWLEKNLPGLIEQSTKYYENVREATIYYSVQAYNFSKDKAIVAVEWAKTNVFVGKLSPENLQRLTLEVVNTTQEYVKSGYKWIVQQANSAQ